MGHNAFQEVEATRLSSSTLRFLTGRLRKKRNYLIMSPMDVIRKEKGDQKVPS